jgi:hypothetical protein
MGLGMGMGMGLGWDWDSSWLGLGLKNWQFLSSNVDLLEHAHILQTGFFEVRNSLEKIFEIKRSSYNHFA